MKIISIGYKGHSSMVIPHKRRKGTLLTIQQAAYNQKLSKARVVVENTIKRVKDWKAVAHSWRQRLFLHPIAFHVIVQLTNITLRVRPCRIEPPLILFNNL